MQRVKVLAFLVLAAFLAFSCSKDSSNDSTPTGGNNTGNSSAGSLSTHTGKNIVVTQANVDSVSSVIISQTFLVFEKALETSFGGAAKPTVEIPISGNVNGLKSGKAVVSGKYTLSSDYNTTSYNFTCTFYDYSDDAVLYYGGAINYTGNTTSTTQVYNLTFKGGLSFNGAYQGTQDFTITYIEDISKGSFSYQSTMTTTSGGKTFTTTSKYPL